MECSTVHRYYTYLHNCRASVLPSTDTNTELYKSISQIYKNVRHSEIFVFSEPENSLLIPVLWYTPRVGTDYALGLCTTESRFQLALRWGKLLNFSGHILKEKRESLGFSYQHVSDHLSIPSEIIRALESGDPSRIPNSSFAAGFLRSYCRFLGIEAEMMIADFQKASKARRSNPARRKPSRRQFSFPTLRLPSFSLNLPAELIGWLSITVLLILSWVAYSTFAPSADPADANETEATSIDLRVPEVNSRRDSR